MTRSKVEKLIFVYNADSGMQNALLDSVHKVLSPSTYQCSLCELTFGLVSERKLWKEFRESSPIEMEFLHRDEFQDHTGVAASLPVILAEGTNGLSTFMYTAEIDQLANQQELITAIRSRLEAV